MISEQEPGARPHYHSHALSRGLALLRIVAASSGPTTLARLHEATGNPKSTLVRLLSVLEDEDYLVRVDERPSFRLGHGVLPIAAGYLSSGNVTDVVRPSLSTLAAKTGWTANFGVLEGAEILHVCVEYADRPLRYTASEGESAPAYCSGLGKTLLADLPDEQLEAHLPAEPFPSFTEHTITTVRKMRSDLAQVRSRGYALDNEESAVGLRCVAVAVRADDAVLGALSVSGPIGEFEKGKEDEIAALLKTTAEDLASGVELRSALMVASRTSLQS